MITCQCQLSNFLNQFETFENKRNETMIKEWVARSNFRRACKNFSIENGQFYYLYKEIKRCSYGETETIRHSQ